MNSQLVDYLYINHAKLDDLVSQLALDVAEEKKRSMKASISFSGPKLELLREISKRVLKPFEKIDRLIDYLNRAGRLNTQRPTEMGITASYVLETTLARKVIIPPDMLAPIPSLKEMALWISDPLEDTLLDIPHEYHGTFLYLTEAHWEEGGMSTVWSGCSALQAIVNITQGNPLFQPSIRAGEPFGRWNPLHPIEKLKSIGGYKMEMRRIRTLYKVRYLTNEQTFLYNKKKKRVNDLLGYPIFIAETT